MDVAPEKRRPGRPRKERVDPPTPLQASITPIAQLEPDEAPKRPPAARGLGAPELRAILDDAMRAQEEHDRSFRTDSLGRHWTFGDAQANNHAVFRISLKRMNDEREAVVGAGEFGTDGIRERVAGIIASLSEGLA